MQFRNLPIALEGQERVCRSNGVKNLRFDVGVCLSDSDLARNLVQVFLVTGQLMAKVIDAYSVQKQSIGIGIGSTAFPIIQTPHLLPLHLHQVVMLASPFNQFISRHFGNVDDDSIDVFQHLRCLRLDGFTGRLFPSRCDIPHGLPWGFSSSSTSTCFCF